MKKKWTFTAIIFLCSCTGVPISSVYKMMTANPLEFHPSEIAVAIKRPKYLQFQDGSVTLGVAINSKTPFLYAEQEYLLSVENTNTVPSSLDTHFAKNEALTLLRLSDQDVIRMQKLQQQMKQHLKNGGKEKHFGFWVRVNEGCKMIKKVPKEVLISVFMKLDTYSDFFPLYEAFNLATADLAPLKNMIDWEYCS